MLLFSLFISLFRDDGKKLGVIINTDCAFSCVFIRR